MATFLTPILLAGSLLVAIPILLHLVMRQKPRHLEFPALRFIQQRREANRRRLRLRHLLLLLLRCAAIVVLAVAMARPIFQSAGLLPAGRAPVAAALVFDTRPRMEYQHRNQSRLEVAQELGRGLLRQLPPDSDCVVLDAAGSRSRFDVDRGAAAQRVEQLAITYLPEDLLAMLDNALRVVRTSELERKEVFVYTDLAHADWSDDKIAKAWQRRREENPDVDIYVIDVGLEELRNSGLSDIRLSSEVVSENQLLRVEADVAHLGAEDDRTVQLFVERPDGEIEKKGEQTVRVGEEAARVELKTVIGGLGAHQGYLRLAGSDNLASDDIRYFTVRVKPPWQILVAAPEPAERNARLLTAALAPATLRRRGEAQYEFDVISLAALVDREVARYDAIWLLDPTPLPTATWNRLASYVADGGGLAIALGGKAGLAGDKFNATVSLQVMPAELKRQRKTPEGADLYLAPAQLEHPVLRRFKRREGQIPWQLNPVFKIWELQPPAKDVEVLVPYSDGRPALLARNVGQGRVLTLTTTLAERARFPWNQLLAPKEEAWPGFVLVHGMTEYIVGRVGQRLNYLVGEVAEVPLGREKRYEGYLLSAPQGTRRVKASDEERSLLISGTESPGNYRLEAGGRQGVRYGFSINVPAAATQLDRITVDEVRETLGDAAPAVVRTNEQLARSRKVAAARSRWEAFPWLMVIVVAVVAAEGLVSSLFYRKSSSET